MNELAVVLLAAGQGTRMNSRVQKILHEVGGAPMVQHVFDAARAVADLPPVLVVGPGANGVRALFGERAWYVEQAEQLGTGHAALMAKPLLDGRCTQVIVAYGDMPLLQAETMARLADRQAETGAAVAMLTIEGDPASSFGRVARDGDGRIAEIVEVAEARQRPDPDRWLRITEHNPGFYCFEASFLWENLESLPVRQARNGPEYYLTDLIARAVATGREIVGLAGDDPDEALGAGTRSELVAVERAFRRRANRRAMDAGVTLIDPDSTFIDQSVTLGQDTVIWPGTYLQGDTHIGRDCVIGPHAIIRDSRLGDGCRVEMAVVEGTELEAGMVVGPFAHCRGDKGGDS